MKIALGQFDVKAGLPEQNVATMLDFIYKAKSKKCDLICLPEMCIGGYFIGDKYNDDDYCHWLMSFNDQISQASSGIGVIFGNVFISNNKDNFWFPNEDGRTKKYNAAYFYYNNKPVHKIGFPEYSPLLPDGIQVKSLLPNYRFFDDQRYFTSAYQLLENGNLNVFGNFNFKDKEIGVTLCEDMWCKDYVTNKKTKNTILIKAKHADVIINISASPWTYKKNQARDNAIKFIYEEIDKSDCKNNPQFYYVNNVGAQNNGKNILTFDGGSSVYNRQGNLVQYSKNPYKEELLVIDSYYDVDLASTLSRVNEPKIAEKYQTLIRGLQHMRDILGSKSHPRFVIGLSGGIDSAVVACLLVKAIGRDKVMAINMPSRYSSDKTKDVAKSIASKLGIRYRIIPIQNVSTETLTAINKAGEWNSKNINLQLSAEQNPGPECIDSLVLENIDARVRGSAILAGVAAKMGALYTNNGNKLETALGYATLYGDINGAIAPLGDLTKEEVFEMARYMNAEIFNAEIIPTSLIPNKLYKFDIAPSAELKNDQIDPFKFGYHDRLLELFMTYKNTAPETILEWYLSNKLCDNLGITKDLFYRWNLNDPKEFVKDIEWFIKQMNNNVFKRIQSPPIVVTSKRAFGFDHRESQLPLEVTDRFKALRDQILTS